MPLVRIDINQGRTPEQRGQISEAVHQAILTEYGIPERDLFHILTQHGEGEILAQDAGLGFQRTNQVVMIQIFTQAGRSPEAKAALFARIAAALEGIGVEGANVFIGYVENGPGDWSFGFGRSQYMNGELAIPAR